MSAYAIDVIMPCGTNTRRPAQIRPVVTGSGISNMTVQVTNNLGDASPVWVTTTNDHAVLTPNFAKETTNWEIGIRVTGEADSDAAYIAEPKCFVAAVESGATVPLGSWADATDDEIAAMIHAAHLGEIDLQADAGWAIGDKRTIPISAFTADGSVAEKAQNAEIAISSFDDYNNCGCVMQFDFVDCLASRVRINSATGTTGGYGATTMYSTTLPRLVNALPAYLRDMLIEFSVLIGASSSSIATVTGNLLALRAEVEILGTAATSFVGEGTLIPYYATAGNRIKKLGSNGSAILWVMRSPHATKSTYFCRISAEGAGYSGTYPSTTASGVAPFGCL